MSDEGNVNMWSGTHGRYFWVAGAIDTPLTGPVPIRLEGRRVVVTSFDSGELRLTESEISDGWAQCGRTAVSPPLVDPHAIPVAGHDEWYIFDGTPPDLSDIEIFVSYMGFSTIPVAEREAYEHWDVVVRRDTEALQARFWDQLERIGPYSYLADGDLVTLATQSEAERDDVLNYWRALPTSTKVLPYWIQRADYSSADFAAVDVAAALRAFAGHHWNAEHALLSELKQSGAAHCPPGIAFVDPEGPVLHICPSADGRAMVHYHSKVASKVLGFIRTTKDVDYTRERVERSVVVHFIQCFFDRRHDVIVRELTVQSR